jgi:hypothetical protein
MRAMSVGLLPLLAMVACGSGGSSPGDGGGAGTGGGAGSALMTWLDNAFATRRRSHRLRA